MNRAGRAGLAAAILLLTSGALGAHVSERAIVLLLPTEIYRTVGVMAVVATVLLTVFLPPRRVRRVFLGLEQPLDVRAPHDGPGSIVGFSVFFGLIALGLLGPQDPLGNLLPLTVIAVWWICLLSLSAVVGNLWHWLNPWAAPARWLFAGRHLFRLPAGVGQWPAIAGYFLFAIYYLSDLAPDDPDRFAMFAFGYWLATFLLVGLFGPEWLRRGECFTVLFDLAGRMSPIDWRARKLRFPGRTIVSAGTVPLSLGVFCVSFLAVGSFDGLNETFWWMAQIGINPLEFPGRSAVVWQNRLGLVCAVIALNLVFGSCVWLGLRIAGGRQFFWPVLARSGLAVLPIALAYHLAHYLPSVLVSLQYWLNALNDPLDTGARLLGMEHRYVTTSFFNQHHTVRLIWLSQAAAIVIGHVIAVLLAHGVAVRLFDDHWRALRSQLFIAAFMVGYTFFGLWLLASPTAL